MLPIFVPQRLGFRVCFLDIFSQQNKMLPIFVPQRLGFRVCFLDIFSQQNQK